MNVSIPQSVCWMTTTSRVPSSVVEMISERIASSDDASAGVADDVGVTDFETEDLGRIDPRIHARHDHDAAGGRHRLAALVEPLA